MGRLVITIALLQTAGALSGCNASFATRHDPGATSSQAAPRHTSAEAIQIALKHRPHFMQDLSKYAPPTATYQPDSGIWLIYFQDKAVAIDGCFYLQVDDRTGKLSNHIIVCG
jgi:hypothetical protein